MKSKMFIAVLAACAGICGQTYGAVKDDEPKKAELDSAGFVFTDVKINPHSAVQDQNKSGTCWAFSGISTLEDNIKRKSGKDVKLSEMYVVRNAYLEKAAKWMRMNGKINFAQGGSFPDVLNMSIRYGAVPEEAYPGLNYGEEKHSHYELAEALEAYLNAVLARGTKNGNSAPPG